MTDNPKQLFRADVENMPPEAIVAARKAGQLSDLLAGRQTASSATEQQRSDYLAEAAEARAALGRDQCRRTYCPGRIWATLSMSWSAITPTTG